MREMGRKDERGDRKTSVKRHHYSERILGIKLRQGLYFQISNREEK